MNIPEDSLLAELFKTDLVLDFAKIVPAKKVVVLAPHFDDEVLGCGGTILKYLCAGAEVCIVYLTDGRFGIAAGKEMLRKTEALEAWSEHGNVTQMFFDFEDSKLKEYQGEVVERLSYILNDIQADIVFTPWMLDRHEDHCFTSLFLAEAIAGLKNKSLLVSLYEVAFPIFSNHTVNISDVWEKKIAALRKYKSQNFLNIEAFITALNEFRAKVTRFKSVKQAESFYTCTMGKYSRLVSICVRQ